MSNPVVVISSCDAFADCWRPLLFSLDRFWPDCPWNIYVVSNTKELAHSKVRFLKVGEDLGWASNLKTALKAVDCDWVIYLQEDYWLTRTVNTSALCQHLKYCAENGVDYLRLSYPYFDQYAIDDTCYAESPVGKRYRLCLQAAIWHREALQACLIDGWTGWDFEYKLESFLKSEKIAINSLVLQTSAVSVQGFEYVSGTAVRKGRWTVPAVRFLETHGYDDLIGAREVEGSILTDLMKVEAPGLRIAAKILLRIMQKLNINK
jgi:hypothetical protein